MSRAVRVRDRNWGGRFVGTVVRRHGTSLYVQWADSLLEDELQPCEVDLITEDEFHRARDHRQPVAS